MWSRAAIIRKYVRANEISRPGGGRDPRRQRSDDFSKLQILFSFPEGNQKQ